MSAPHKETMQHSEDIAILSNITMPLELILSLAQRVNAACRRDIINSLLMTLVYQLISDSLFITFNHTV
jgi:hypothetical protein